ncbi:hypothetical protein LCGC14_2212350, partial [marine sediment metagenome]
MRELITKDKLDYISDCSDFSLKQFILVKMGESTQRRKKLIHDVDALLDTLADAETARQIRLLRKRTQEAQHERPNRKSITYQRRASRRLRQSR